MNIRTAVMDQIIRDLEERFTFEAVAFTYADRNGVFITSSLDRLFRLSLTSNVVTRDFGIAFAFPQSAKS